MSFLLQFYYVCCDLFYDKFVYLHSRCSVDTNGERLALSLYERIVTTSGRYVPVSKNITPPIISTEPARANGDKREDY